MKARYEYPDGRIVELPANEPQPDGTRFIGLIEGEVPTNLFRISDVFRNGEYLKLKKERKLIDYVNQFSVYDIRGMSEMIAFALIKNGITTKEKFMKTPDYVLEKIGLPKNVIEKLKSNTRNDGKIRITNLANKLVDLEKYVNLNDIKELYKEGNDLVIIRKGLSDVRVYDYFSE